MNFGRLPESFGRVNFGRLQQYLVAVVRNLLINQPRLVRGISGTSAYAHRASLVRADRLTLLRAAWIFPSFNSDEIWCLQIMITKSSYSNVEIFSIIIRR